MAEAPVDEKGLVSLIECAICLSNVTNHRVLPCQHLFCQICLEPMVTDGSISCPVCRRPCNLGGLRVDSLPRNLLLVALLDQLCELCQTRSRTLKCTHCEKWTCKVCHQKCRDDMIRTLHKLTSETAELRTAGNSRHALLFQDTVRLDEEIAEASKRIDQNLEMAIKRATTEHQEQKAELQVWGKLELEQLRSCYQESAANLIKLEEFEQKYSDLIGSDVNQSKDMSSICKDLESCIRSARDADSTRPKVHVVPRPRSYGLLYKSLSEPRLMVGLKGTGPSNFDCPSFVSVSWVTNNIYISDTENNRIQVLNEHGEFLLRFGSRGTSRAKFALCEGYMAGGVHATSEDRSRLLVTDTGNNRLKIYNGDFKVIDVFGQEGSGRGQLSLPLGITTDRRGHIYVSEAGNERIQVFDASGTSLRVFGTRLDWDPCGIAICPNGNIVVADRGEAGFDNGKIEIFSNKGQNIRTIDHVGSSRLKSPRDVAVNREGNMIVTDAEAHKVYIIRENGDLIKTLGCHGNEPGQFKYPSGVACLEDGGLIVIDQGNHRVQIF